MARTGFAGMATLHRWLFIAANLGFLIVGITRVLDSAWRPLVEIVVGALAMTLGAIVGFNVGGTATQFSAHRRQVVGGEQPLLDSVAGVRVVHAVFYGGAGVLCTALGVWGVLR